MQRNADRLQVYKSHLTEGRAPSGPAVDSARQNLASTFVNAFVNAGFGQDKLMTVIPDSDSSENVHWIFKNKVPCLQRTLQGQHAKPSQFFLMTAARL